MSYSLNIKEIRDIIEKEKKSVEKIPSNIREERYKKILNSKEFNDTNEKKKLETIYYLVGRDLEKEIEYNILTAKMKEKKIDLIIDDCGQIEKCLKKIGCKNIKSIDSGAYGQVFLVTKNNKKYAVKYQIFKYWNAKNYIDFVEKREKEYNIAKKIGENKIGPKIYNRYYIYQPIKGELANCIFMEYIKSQTLSSYLAGRSLTEDEKDKIDDLIKKMHKLKIYHKDLHFGNILVRKEKKSVKFLIIDFGLSVTDKNILNNAKKNDLVMLKYLGNYQYNTEIFLSIYNLLSANKIEIMY